MYQWTTYKNPVYVTENNDRINCLITFTDPNLGEVPFTASKNDVEQHGREIYQYIIDNANNIPISDYVSSNTASSNTG